MLRVFQRDSFFCKTESAAPETAALAEFLREARGVHHELLGHAPAQHAGAAGAADGVAAHEAEGQLADRHLGACAAADG